MTRILLRSPQDPAAVLRPLESTGKIGTNTGNLLYIFAVHRALSIPGATVGIGGYKKVDDASIDRWVAKVNKRYDRFVMPLANSFRTSFSDRLVGLTRMVRGLDMPVTVIGIGGQAPIEAIDEETGQVKMGRTGSTRLKHDNELARHDNRVLDFVEAVLEKSKSIGVRGPITKQYLVSLGVDPDRVDVIGCPSLFMWGPGLRIVKRARSIDANAKLSMNIDYRVAGMGPIVERNVELYPRMTSVAQDSGSARVIISGKDEFDLGKRDPRTPIHTGHPLYQQGRLLYFANAWGWIEYMRQQDFVFGSRLHGNIAALLGKTPAHLLVHDIRTLELAEYFGIPYSKIHDFTEPPTAAELYERSDYTRFNELHTERFRTYLEFLRRNEFATVFDVGQNADAFDEGIERGRRTGPVRSRSVGAMLARTAYVPSKVKSVLGIGKR